MEQEWPIPSGSSREIHPTKPYGAASNELSPAPSEPSASLYVGLVSEQSEPGACEVCSLSKDGLEQVGDDLHRRAFAHFDPPEHHWRTSYQSDVLYRCPACGTMWLHQYWEIDTPETALEEWGLRNYEWTCLTSNAVEEIGQALLSGVLIPQNRFRA